MNDSKNRHNEYDRESCLQNVYLTLCTLSWFEAIHFDVCISFFQGRFTDFIQKDSARLQQLVYIGCWTFVATNIQRWKTKTIKTVYLWTSYIHTSMRCKLSLWRGKRFSSSLVQTIWELAVWKHNINKLSFNFSWSYLSFQWITSNRPTPNHDRTQRYHELLLHNGNIRVGMGIVCLEYRSSSARSNDLQHPKTGLV